MASSRAPGWLRQRYYYRTRGACTAEFRRNVDGQHLAASARDPRKVVEKEASARAHVDDGSSLDESILLHDLDKREPPGCHITLVGRLKHATATVLSAGEEDYSIIALKLCIGAQSHDQI